MVVFRRCRCDLREGSAEGCPGVEEPGCDDTQRRRGERRPNGSVEVQSQDRGAWIFEDERAGVGSLQTDAPTTGRLGGRVAAQTSYSLRWKQWSGDASTAFLRGDKLTKPVFAYIRRIIGAAEPRRSLYVGSKGSFDKFAPFDGLEGLCRLGAQESAAGRT